MGFSSRVDQLHFEAKSNKWLHLFTIFNRVALAAGFIPSGIVKILGERFTDLSNQHPLGNYLEALHHTGYYYTFIGIAQVVAAALLLIPQTALLGVFLYFPIILNICLLSMSVRFEGSLLTAPLMVMSCIYLICWDYHKIKFIFPYNYSAAKEFIPQKEDYTFRFPFKFFSGVFLVIFMVVYFFLNGYNIVPRNTLDDCLKQCKYRKNPKACAVYCDCIHKQGRPHYKCLNAYNQASTNK